LPTEYIKEDIAYKVTGNEILSVGELNNDGQYNKD
jgi:hypothetical protein